MVSAEVGDKLGPSGAGLFYDGQPQQQEAPVCRNAVATSIDKNIAKSNGN